MIDTIKENKTLKELMLGSIAYGAVFMIPLIIFTERKLYHVLGLLIGILISLILAYNMAESIDVAVILDEKSADAYLRKKASIRYLIVCVAVIAVGVSDFGNVLTCMAGVMGLKIGAYLQPLTHKLLNPNEEKPVYPVINNEEGGEAVDE